MLVLLLSLAHADYDGGYSYDSGCYVSYGCNDCERCDDLTCETEAEDLGKELICRNGDGTDTSSVWCDCGGVGDDDDDVTGDDDDGAADDTSADDDADKAGTCGCDASASPVTVFGALALISGGLLFRRRQSR